MSSVIRIYVADVAAYNNGRLHGVWINACNDIEQIQIEIAAMLKASPEAFAEEYAIHDHEGFEEYALGEYEGISRAHEIACFIEEHAKLGSELLSYYGGNLEEAKQAIDEQYAGCYKSLADFAEEMTEGTVEIPDSVAYYIDYERMGRDWEMSGDVFTIQNGYEEVHIFWSR